MYKILRIIFCIVAACFAASVLFLGAFFGITYALISAGIAAVFFMLTLYCKKKQEEPEKKAEDQDLLERQCSIEDKKEDK